MSRLIDADSYLKKFCNRFCSVKECTSTQKKSCCIAISLNDEPTAFDVDKVVERLQEQEEKHFHHDFDKDKFEFGAFVASVNAIEIVKEGGT